MLANPFGTSPSLPPPVLEKTVLSEALAFSAKAIDSMGSTQKGNTVSDFELEEIHRHHSVSSSLLQFDWKGTRITLVDTPGSIDFFSDVKSCLSAVDSVVHGSRCWKWSEK